MDECYKELIYKIIQRACWDYINAIRKTRLRNNNKAQQTIAEVEEFFLSGWFLMLTDLDGKILISKLKEVNPDEFERKIF